MFKHVFALAALATLSACATTPESQRDCVTQTEESTGSRVESSKVCPPSD